MMRPEDARGRDVALAGLFTVVLISAIVASLHGLVSFAGIRTPPRAPERHLERGADFEGSANLDAAVSEYEKALVAARASDRPELVARAANRLAALRRRAGELAIAHSLAETALDAALGSGATTESSEALFNLGNTESSMGRLREALRSFESSAATAARARDAGLEARALLYVGLTAMMLERHETARVALGRATAISKSLGDPALEATVVRALGQLHSRLGESQKALERYAEARALLEPLEDAAGEAVLSNAIGQVYFDMGLPETALRSYGEALETHRRLGYRQREAASLLEMGRCHLELRQFDLAARRFGAALRIYRELDNPRFEADVLSEMGRLSERSGDVVSAFRRFDAAIALKRAAGDARYLAYALNEAARLHLELGELGRARPYLEEALGLSRQVHDPGAESLALYQTALASRGEGRLERALSEAEQSVAIIEELRGKTASHALRRSLLSEAHARYFLVVELSARLHERHPGSGYDDRAFAASERARARTLLDSLEEAAEGIRTGVAPDLLAEERSLRERLNEAAHEQLLIPASEAEAAARLKREIEALSEEHDRVQSRIRSRSPRYAALTDPETPSLAEVQSRWLDADTRVVAYALGAESSFLWSVTRESRSLFELPPGPEIEEIAERVHRALSSPGPPKRAERDLETLRDILLGRVSGLESTRRLLVLTEGTLNDVPFGALPLSPGAPLVTTTEVVRMPSLAALTMLRTGPGRAQEPRALVVADPVYERDDARLRAAAPGSGGHDTRRFELSRLRGSGREAEAIASLGPPGAVEVLSGLQASREGLVSKDLSAYRFVHFATHARIDDARPELSGIVLSLVDGEGRSRDGFLRLQDIYNLSIPAELVVLSACETALGADVRGEGLVGLVRGFFYAGASSVIASTWKVEDEATAELMRLFYERLFAGTPRASALREAQAALRAEPKWRDPFYWAGFELQGDWR